MKSANEFWPRGDAIFDWCRQQLSWTVAAVLLPSTWSWQCSTRRRIVLGAAAAGPICKWKQADSKSFLWGETLSAGRAPEALVHGRKFCYACSLALPASHILMIEHLLSSCNPGRRT